MQGGEEKRGGKMWVCGGGRRGENLGEPNLKFNYSFLEVKKKKKIVNESK